MQPGGGDTTAVFTTEARSSANCALQRQKLVLYTMWQFCFLCLNCCNSARRDNYILLFFSENIEKRVYERYLL